MIHKHTPFFKPIRENTWVGFCCIKINKVINVRVGDI
nr:MAG TPA: hypothetical protein [Caudoviricetes sp.]